MRICPNCRAENDDNALTCILCELEFDDITEADSEPAPAEEYDAPFEGAVSESVADTVDYAEPVNVKPTAAPMNSAASDFERASSSGGKGKIIAIAAAAIIIVAGGIGVGAFLLKDKNNAPEDSADNGSSAVVSITASTKAEETTAAPKSTETTTKAQETTEADTVTESSSLKTFSASDICNYPQYIDAIKGKLDSKSFEASDAEYSLFDLNGDNAPEMFINSSSGWGLYSINGSSYYELKSCFGAPRLPSMNFTDKGFVVIGSVSGAGQNADMSYYSYNGGETLEAVDSFSGETTASSEELKKLQEKYGKEIPITFEAIDSIRELLPSDSTSSQKSTNNSELGVMYNLFYIEALKGYTGGGYIEDYNGDGVDDLIYWSGNIGYSVCYYRNGSLESSPIPGTETLGYNEPIFGMKTAYFTDDVLPDKCREKAINSGYTANSEFYMGSTGIIGYVKLSDMNSTLNLRSAPNTNSEVLTQLPNGKLFNLLFEDTGGFWGEGNNGFYYVSVNCNGKNYMGYVSKDYVVAWENYL